MINRLVGEAVLDCPSCSHACRIPRNTEIGEIFMCSCTSPVVLDRDGPRAILRLMMPHEFDALDRMTLAKMHRRIRATAERATFRMLDVALAGSLVSEHLLRRPQ